jgi:acetyltransferase
LPDAEYEDPRALSRTADSVTHPLQSLFEPAVVAVVGASDTPDTVGGAVLRRMQAGGFAGALYPVNPRHPAVAGLPCFPSLRDLPGRPDVALVASPAATLPAVLRDAIEVRCKAVVLLGTAAGNPDDDTAAQCTAALATARQAGLRILGPNTLGVIRPRHRFNGSFTATDVRPGTTALLAQSGGLTSAVLDRGAAEGLGFSCVVSLGNQTDLDFADVLDFVTHDPATESVVMYIEGVPSARRFVSALRAAARIKPVIVLKSGRETAGSRAASTHTGAITGPDEAFDAALRRCGAVRVDDFLQLYAATKYLASRYRPVARNLAIVTNSGGPGVMAADRAGRVGLTLATLSPATVERLERELRGRWSRDNPVDLMEDARPPAFAQALDACLADPAVDGVIAIVTPQVMTDPSTVADLILAAAGRTAKPLIACLLGDTSIRAALPRLQAARIPTFRAPEPAVEAFADIARFYENQRLLMQVPGPRSHEKREPDVEGARAIVTESLAAGRDSLSLMETKALLGAFHIPVSPSAVARTPSEAIVLAQQFGFPVVLKANARGLEHKSDVGGVRLDLRNATEVREAMLAIERDLRASRPDLAWDGATVEPMVVKAHGRELILGVLRDPVFGPVISFGAGGRAVEVFQDHAVALPPLNAELARALISRTRVGVTLAAWRGWPAADAAALEDVLLRLSELACALPELEVLEINPLIVDEAGAIAVDARAVLSKVAAPSDAGRYGHMAIMPYPTELTTGWTLADGRQVTVRAIRPEDATMEQAFVRALSDESRYFRFANALHELSDSLLVRFTQIDYDRELALVAVVDEGNVPEQIGVARYVIDTDGITCEFAIALADAWQGQGIGRRLLARLTEAARARGLRTMVGQVLPHNNRMLGLMNAMGFTVGPDPEEPTMRRVVLDLTRVG